MGGELGVLFVEIIVCSLKAVVARLSRYSMLDGPVNYACGQRASHRARSLLYLTSQSFNTPGGVVMQDVLGDNTPLNHESPTQDVAGPIR